MTTRERKLKHRNKLRKEVLDRYGGKCVCCGINDYNLLSMDHINNDGNLHRAITNKAYSIYQWLRVNNYPDNIVQILCYNCNLAKGFFGICPHIKIIPLPISNSSLSRSEQKRIAGIRARRKLKYIVLAHYSLTEHPSCIFCGESSIEFLAIDHINGQGKQHRQSIGKTGATSFYRWIKDNNFPPLFQTLCHNCNSSKEFNRRNQI